MFDYGANISQYSSLSVNISNYGDWGYGEYQYEPTGVKVFYTANYNGNNTEWVYLGGKLVAYDETPLKDAFFYSFTSPTYVDKILVSRVGLHTYYPDPRIYNVKVKTFP
ncbi:MAG TPA: hypothetical protein VJB89_02060 [Candidatus Nanoarchaeia archaeon]|nr:hypothetical protein [Candidatus Nanoarchaeia archaeon]